MTRNAVVGGWAVEYSYEATTLDYLSPLWYPVREGGPDSPQVTFPTEEAAQAYITAARAAQGNEPCVWKAVAPAVPAVTYTETDPFLEAEFAANRQFWAGRARAAEAAERNEPKPGRTVEVVSGKKVPVGTTGFVIWYGPGKYRDRVGIKDADGEVWWTDARNVAVRYPEDEAA